MDLFLLLYVEGFAHQSMCEHCSWGHPQRLGAQTTWKWVIAAFVLRDAASPLKVQTGPISLYYITDNHLKACTSGIGLRCSFPCSTCRDQYTKGSVGWWSERDGEDSHLGLHSPNLVQTFSSGSKRSFGCKTQQNCFHTGRTGAHWMDRSNFESNRNQTQTVVCHSHLAQTQMNLNI